MDLPPRFRRHPRYGNVTQPPRFVHHHLTPLAPPPLLPPSPPRILLPPLFPPRHEGQFPFPSHFSSPPYLPTLERSYFQELDPLRKPYIDRYHPHPTHQDNSPFRIIHDYSLRNSIIEDEIFRRGCSNNYAYDFPRTCGQELPCGATEGNSRSFEMEHRRYGTSRVSGIEARDTWKDTNADARRWESWDHRSRELYFEREDDDRRLDCGINRGRELCFGRNIDSRRWECVISGGRELSFDRDDNRIRLDYGINDGISLQLENRQQEFLESNLGLHRFSGRLGRVGSKREFHRPRKMNRVQKKSALHRIRLGKAHRRHIRGKKILNNLSSSSLRGRDKENFECLETLAKDNQETEQSPVDLSISFKSNSLVAKAILVASSPVSKEEICLSSRNPKIRKINNMVDTGSDNSSKVVTEQISGFQSGALCPRIELLEKFNDSGNEKVTAYKVNSSGEASKDMHSQCLDNFRSGSRLGRRSKKKRRNQNNILHGMRLLLSEDSGEIVNFATSTFSTSDASKLNTNSTFSRVDMSSLSIVLPEADLLLSLGSIASEKVDIGSDTNRPSFSDQKMKYTSLNNLSASLPMSDDASTECSAKDANWASQMGTDEVTGHAGGLCLADEKIGHGDGFGFKWHADSVELHVRKWGSISDLEKNLLDSKDLLTGLGAVRVDSTDEQPFQNGLVFENAFDGVPFKCPPSVQVEDITGLSRHHESNIPTVTRSNFLSADHKGTVIEADISLVKTDNQSYKDGANLCNKSGCIEGASESKIKRRRKRKRKARGTQMCISGSNATEPVDKGSSVGYELANLLATDISSVKEVDSPGAEDNFEATIRLKEGPSVDNQSYKDGTNLCNKSGCIEGASESKIKRKRKRKRKARGTQMGISGSNATEPVDKGSSVGDELANLLATDISSVKEADFPGAEDNFEVTFRLKEGPSVDNQSYKDGANLCNKSGCIEGASESKIMRKRKRKRKARGTQMGISGSNATEPVDKGGSVGNELANLLATDISSVKEADFPGAEDNSKVTFRLKEGTSVDLDSHLDAVDFSGDGSFPGNIKKRKVVSSRLNFSSCLVDDSIGDCLASDDLKLDQVSFRPAEHDADQSEETLSAMRVASTDGSENFSIPNMDGTVAYGNNNLHLKDELAFVRNTLSTCADGSDDCATQSGDELVAPGFDTPPCISSPEDLLSHTDFHSESEMIFEGFQTSNIKPVSVHSTTFSLRNSIENATSGHLQTNNKVPPPLPQKTDKVQSSKNKPTSAVPNIYGYPAFNFHTSRKFPCTHFSKSRTWHRTEQSSINVSGPTIRPCPLPQSYVPKTSKISQNSYVRKGNSLVRKPSSSGGSVAHTPSSSVYPTSPCMDYIHNNQVKADTPCIPRIGQVNSSDSSQSLPLNHTGRSLRSASYHSVASLPVTNSLGSCGPAKTLDAIKETAKSFEIPECQTGSGNNSDGLSTLGKENLGKKISYVKRRSNQLIATSDPKDSSTSGLDKSEASLSDGYYKNSKNQLIRVPSESHVRKGDSMETLNSNRLGSQTILPISSGKRQSSKGFSKIYRLSKFSLVWNLNGAQFPDKSSNSLGPRKVWPYLFPWRKATNRSSLPTISQKLLLSSKRGAIYTRSTHGYSLRISKVLSVCGRSLKWSKSIERNSKKANEDSTRAVAAAEKRKKEEKDVISILSKSRNHVSRKSVVSVKLCPGERIFRIGSERYKMDPSRRSLHRITEEEEPSPSDVLQSEKNLKKSYLPKRLLIGNDEYVRIGTGNQLVRDPKKRTRVLASEKVRWSLRTARLRLARKRKYCQFFTRFGKCNKSDGKCPYIHDPSKIVVCTKFVNGSCTDSDCKLTHKVIPERMPDCSYFLKGSCSNENCPYRHVNVNPESSICKRFLRGYCADGNECGKKHTYVCPAFESTGLCPQSAMCKLHHPKKKTENKPVIEQKIVRGRYFDGGLIDVAECSMATGEKLSAKGEDDKLCEEGKYPDYISLDISNDGPEMSVL